jgi:hypothetical protein
MLQIIYMMQGLHLDLVIILLLAMSNATFALNRLTRRFAEECLKMLQRGLIVDAEYGVPHMVILWLYQNIHAQKDPFRCS